MATIGAGSRPLLGLVSGRVYEFYPVYDEASSTLKFLGNSDVTSPASSDSRQRYHWYVTGDTAVSNPGNFTAEIWIRGTGTGRQPLV